MRTFLRGLSIVGFCAVTIVSASADAMASELRLAQAEQATEAPSTAPNWIVRCTETEQSDSPVCRMSQNIIVQGSRQRLLTVIIEPREGAPNHALVLALPHGLFLPAGVTLKIDDAEPLQLAVQTSDANGAYAGTGIGDDLLERLKNGQTLQIGMQSAQRQNLTVPVTLVGFTSAYDKLSLRARG